MNLEHSKLRRLIEVALLILISCIFFFACGKEAKVGNEIVEISGSEEAPEEASEIPREVSGETENKTVFVYVCGAVVNPAVYELPSDARRADAIAAAGGFTEDAALDAVNLAAHIEDADMLRIPFLGEDYSGEWDDKDTGKETKININTAGVSELTALPGIGKSKAEAIVDYRKKAGRYTCTEDLMKVPGIKEGTFEGIRDLIKTE